MCDEQESTFLISPAQRTRIQVGAAYGSRTEVHLGASGLNGVGPAQRSVTAAEQQIRVVPRTFAPYGVKVIFFQEALV